MVRFRNFVEQKIKLILKKISEFLSRVIFRRKLTIASIPEDLERTASSLSTEFLIHVTGKNL